MIPGYRLTKKANPLYGEGAPEVFQRPAANRDQMYNTFTTDLGRQSSDASRAATREILRGAVNLGFTPMAKSVQNTIYSTGVPGSSIYTGANSLYRDIHDKRNQIADIINRNPSLFLKYNKDSLKNMMYNLNSMPGMAGYPMSIFSMAPVIQRYKHHSTQPGYRPTPQNISKVNPMYRYGGIHYPSITQALALRDANNALKKPSADLRDITNKSYIMDSAHTAAINSINQTSNDINKAINIQFPGKFNDDIISKHKQTALFNGLGGVMPWSPLLSAPHTASVKALAPLKLINNPGVRMAAQVPLNIGIGTNSMLLLQQGLNKAIGMDKNLPEGFDLGTYGTELANEIHNRNNILEMASYLNPVSSGIRKGFNKVIKEAVPYVVGDNPAVMGTTLPAYLPNTKYPPNLLDYYNTINNTYKYRGRYTPWVSDGHKNDTEDDVLNKLTYNYIMNTVSPKIPQKPKHKPEPLTWEDTLDMLDEINPPRFQD